MKTLIFVILFIPSICFSESFGFIGNIHQTPDNCQDCKVTQGRVEIPNGKSYRYNIDCNVCESIGGDNPSSCTLMACKKPEMKTYCDRNKDSGKLENCLNINK